MRYKPEISEQYGLDWSQVDFERRHIHLPKTKNGDPQTVPLNSIALAALKELDGGSKKMKPMPVFPSVRTGKFLQRSRGWFAARSRKRRSKVSLGIATAILLQVDS
jgi:integrase